jgi:hypothetical protein
MRNELKIVNHLREHFSDDTVIHRNKGKFWDMAMSKSSVAWGGQPLFFDKFAISLFQFSPNHKGDKPTVLFDYITEKIYKKRK